jgi:hypothetical protein
LADYYQPKAVIPDLMEGDAVTIKIEIGAVIWIPKETD